MKTIIPAPAAAAVVALLLALSGCTETAKDAAADNPLLAAPVPDGMVRGTVVETMDAAGYTYVRLDDGEREIWIAGPESVVTVGDVVQASTEMPMTDFWSDSLFRKFDVLYFSSALQNLTAPAPAMTGMHPPIEAEPVVEAIEVAELEPGRNIAYVYANKDELAGQTISLRGQVVKYNANIMGRNFVHIQDGSGDAAAGDNDLALTTTAETKVGETVVVTGTLILDKDFGAGYTYPILLDDATLSTET